MKARSEDGFTLVELMAALTVLAIGIVGTIGVMNSSIRVAGTTSSRSKGVAVATKHIETLRAVPYKTLTPTVTVVPFDETVGNRVYTVRRVVTLENEATATQPAGGTPRANAYKKGYVSVSWTDESGFHEVHQTTLIYPGGLGPADVSQSVIPTGNGTPDPPLSLVGVPVIAAADVDLTWVPPAPSLTTPAVVSYVVQYSRDPTFPPTAVQEVAASLPASVTVLRITDLTSGTAYHFRVYSKSADGKLSATAAQALNVTTAGSVALTCAAGIATVTPSAVYKENDSVSSGLKSRPRVVVNTSGCTGTTFRMEYSPKTGVNRDVGLTADASGTYSGDIDDLTAWDVGDHDVKIFSYAGLVKTSRAELRLTVCAHNKQTCP